MPRIALGEWAKMRGYILPTNGTSTLQRSSAGSASDYDHGYGVGYEDGFKEQQKEIDRLRERLGPRGLEVVMIDGAGHYVNEKVKAEIDRLRALPQSAWQPIETAPVKPVDDVPSYYRFNCILMNEDGIVREGWAEYTIQKKRLVWKQAHGGLAFYPTHWQPLPSPLSRPHQRGDE